MTTIVEVDRRKLNLTNVDKVLYPSGHTKADVIRYYNEIAPIILPFTTRRPSTETG